MTKLTGRRTALRAKYVAVAVTAAFAPWSVYGQTPPPPNQMPNVTVTRGDAVINPVVGTYQRIDQASQRAIYEGSMTMGSNAHLDVLQAYGRSGIGLFRDVSGSLSQIYGRITSNGQVFISNQNGVLFGSTARIDVGGLFATSLSINDTDFMNGRYNWHNAGGAGSVINQGTISTPSGYAALAGPQVRNDGIIQARMGSVVLAAGDRVSLDIIGDGLISVSVDQAALNASAINIGTIEADGGTVLLSARSANALLDTVINAGGAIRATSLIERNGEIVLDGGNAGTVMVAGNHNAGSSSVSGANVTVRGTIVTDIGTGSQTVTTPGTLTIEGVGASASNSGFIHQGSGEQRIEAGNLVMTGGTGIGTNAVITTSDASAEQKITVSGNLQVTGGAAGDGNQAIIRSAGNQTIDGNPIIRLEGGASSGPGGSNTAFIVGAASNTPGKKQKIDAASITMRSGAGGFQNGAVILGPRQEITTTGDVLLAGIGTGGTLGGVRMGGLSTGAGGVANTATDLTLTVGNDLLMRGGVTPSNSANIGSTTGQPQTVTITAARDVVVNDSPASVSRIGTVASTLPTNGTPGSISVTAGRDIKVNGGGEIVTTGTVTLKAANGAVNVSATSPSAGGARIQSGAGQDIQAQSVNITAQNGRSAQLINAGIGTQSVKAGTVEIKTVAPIGGLAEIRNNSAGDQTVTVTGDKLDIKAIGGGTATIFGAGNQTVDMQRAGTKTITLGDNAAQGTSSIVNSGEQKLLGFADIKMTGGSGPVANGSNALIQSNSATRTQRIEANNLEMSNSTLGGNSSVAAILAAQQNIHALANVTMTANASGGTLPGVRIGGLGGGGGAPSATNLTLTVGGDLILQGSTTTANNGVGIGSTGAVDAPAVANNITIDAGGNVILNAGDFDKSGVRIGTSANTGTGTGPGEISITAGGIISLNGTAQSAAAIRTRDGVSLHADKPGGTIGESGNAFILASSLTTTSHGSTSLVGSNEVANFHAASGGDTVLNNTGALTVTGLSAGGNATLDNVGNVTITGPWTAGGTSHITAHSDIVLGALLTSANVALQADGMITEFGTNGVGAIVADTLSTESGGGTFLGGENRVANYSGTSGGELSFFNRGDLNVSALSANTANLSNNGAVTISGPWITASQTNITAFGPGATLSEAPGGYIQATGSSSLSADGGVSLNGPNRISGTLFGSSMQGDFRLTNAGDLNFGAFAFFGDVNLANTGLLNVTSLSGRNLAVANIGPMSISGFWNSTGATSITTAGAAGNLTVNNTVNSQGMMTISVERALTVAASGLQVIPPPPPGIPPVSAPQVASLTSSGGQAIIAKSVVVSAQDGALALISNRATGGQTLTVSGGGLELRSSGGAPSGPGSSTAQILNFGSGEQAVTVSGGGVNIVADAGSASITNVTAANQTIRVLGGSGIDLRSNGGGAAISQVAPGMSQSILVTDADHIRLDGASGSAVISASGGGSQTVSITGSGANAITLGSAAGRGFSGIVNGSAQNVTAGGEGERGSITIAGGALNGATGSIVSRTVAGGTQNVTTSGLLSITGGTAPSQNNSAGIFHNGSGEQKVSAARIELQGGAAGNNNGALIVSSGGGVPANAGAQSINVSGDIVIAGGAGGNAGLSGSATRLQTIRAHNIEMTNSALGGNNSVGFILGGHQDILATGNVTMTARASGGDLPGVRIGGLSANPAIGFAGTGTDLKLVVDGNLTLSGSTTTANNGVGIGSSAAVGTPAFDNNITIEAGGNVSLNAGTFEGSGVRIGTSTNTGTGTGGGDIRITAGGNISLNGTAPATAAIRTRGDVALDGAGISEAGRGLIEANALTTRSSGDTRLGGPNSVSAFTAESDHGNVELTNTSALVTLGSMDLPGRLAIVQTGDVTVGSSTSTEATLVAAAGDISMSASGQILVRGSDTTIGAASAVLAGGDLSFSAGDVTLRAGDAALTPVVVRGANGVQMTVGNELKVTAGGLLSPSLLSSGRNIDLTIGHALRIDGNGPFSLARVQTESREGVISIEFPSLTQGGYFVDGLEGHTHHGQTGFFTDFKPAKVGRTLLLEYGD